jgi:hypothetical protein
MECVMARNFASQDGLDLVQGGDMVTVLVGGSWSTMLRTNTNASIHLE